MARTYMLNMMVVDPNDQLYGPEELQTVVENALDRVDCYDKHCMIIESFPYHWDDDAPENQKYVTLE